jgi:hypothetical protein
MRVFSDLTEILLSKTIYEQIQLTTMVHETVHYG